ncbi:MAG: cytochrome c oxidase subunit II [Flavobacteriales bacterium]|nr:cytochrome c oxidase subunit II [Flavobacteriales bacterium]
MNAVLIVAIAVVAYIVVSQIFRVYELIRELDGPNNKNTVVTEGENKLQANLFFIFMLALFGFFIYNMERYWGLILPPASSIHGAVIDDLMNFNLIFVSAIFVICITILFGLTLRYRGRDDSKAEYIPVNHKLELAWTIAPCIPLTIIIIWGLSTWEEITSPAPADGIVIELYAKQFDWSARYTGDDNELGSLNYLLIEGMNYMGIDATDERGHDDVVVKGEFHIPVGKSINLQMRSQDVIHSAYLPHFRVQMNCVPGMTTRFHFVPTKTTAQMREELGNDEFNYLLYCNKICGATHFNMQMDVIVDTQEDYEAWLAEQKNVTEKGMIAVAEDTKEETTVVTAGLALK